LQEVAVYDEFTIEEMLYYFGRLFYLEPDFLNERILFLISFLDLPNKNRLVKHLRFVFFILNCDYQAVLSLLSQSQVH